MGSGSLRDAILQANADPGASTDTIFLKPGPNGQAYTLSIANINGSQENDAFFGDLDITSRKHDLIIIGLGVNPFGSPDATKTVIDASKLDRAFQIFFLIWQSFKQAALRPAKLLFEGRDAKSRQVSG